MKFMQTSLTARLLVLFLLLAIVPLVAIGLLAYGSGRQSIAGSVEAHLESVAILKEQEMENWVKHLEHTITWGAASPQTTDDAATLAAHAVGEPEHQVAHDSLVAEFRRLAALGHISPVLFLDSASGQIIASSDTSWEGRFRETELWFTRGRTGTYVSDIFHSLALGRPTMVIAAPVTDSDGQLLGVVAGHVDLEGLSEIMLERSGLGETGETYLVNSGNLLLTDLRSEPGAAFKKWMFTEGASRALEGESGVGLYLDYREEPVIGAYRWLEDRDMALLAEIDQAEAFAPVVTLRNTVFGIGLVVALAVALLGLLVARTITRPVRQLVVGVEEIGRGNLDYQIEIRGGDEIGQLAGAFNDMAVDLRESLGEAAHSQRLVLALSEAAQAVQRARTPEEIYQTLGDEVSKLGYHALLFKLTDDRSHLILSHLTFDSGLLRAAEKLAGISAKDFRPPLESEGLHYQVISGGKTMFVESMSERMAESVPRLARPLAKRVATLLDIDQGIYAPLTSEGEAEGLLVVTGADLSEADVPAITAFANQAAIALENTRLYQEIERHAQTLEQRVAERTSELDDARVAALNMMADAEQARRETERANEELRREIEERKRVEEALHQNVRELDVRNRIIRVFLTVPDEEMYTHVLALILEAMESQYGVFGFLDEVGGLVVPTMTRTIWDKCQIPDKRSVFPRETWGDGSWPTAIRQKRTICLNERSTRTPEGHIEIARHISLPVIHQGEVVGLIQVANKESDYTHEDVALLETIGSVIAPVLDARLKRERQEAARQRAEESLARRTQELERSNRELEQFAYVASHDLQEPLRMVSSYTQLIARRYRGQLDADADEFIAFAVDGANHMQQLINDLLAYSRVSTRGQPFAATDCHAVLGQVRANLSAAIQESGALVTNDELPTVMADEAQLVQLFQNLIGNAIKFHTPGEPPRVHISAKKTSEVFETSEVWTFAVRDNGIGIDPQYHERIFVIFQRLHAREEYPGTGIGLAICQRIVERHDGRMWVESELGESATFYFTLPALANQDHE